MSITIVIVEDLDEVREGLRSFIALSPDLNVIGTFKNAEEAFQGIPVLQPDVVIMDISLTGLSGIECIRQLKGKLEKTQFMMFTVYENDEKVFEALKAGATGYLLKNTGIVQLIEALKELHRGGSPMSANIARKLVSHFQNEHPSGVLREILSNRETEVLHLLSKGLLYKEIAGQLSLSTGTVRQHIHNIYEKLHVQNRTEALNKAYGKN
ncbi:MAG: DNA-binding response regulator [Marivirga sp.]|nr:DNA-binding response regulator [Marivirga sp.]